MMCLAKRLKQARKQAGYTQEQLAERIGVSRAAIARFEAGEIEPSLKTLILLADTLRVSTDALLDRDRYALPQPGGASAPFPGQILEQLTPAAREALDRFVTEVMNGAKQDE